MEEKRGALNVSLNRQSYSAEAEDSDRRSRLNFRLLPCGSDPCGFLGPELKIITIRNRSWTWTVAYKQTNPWRRRSWAGRRVPAARRGWAWRPGSRPPRCTRRSWTRRRSGAAGAPGRRWSGWCRRAASPGAPRTGTWSTCCSAPTCSPRTRCTAPGTSAPQRRPPRTRPPVHPRSPPPCTAFLWSTIFPQKISTDSYANLIVKLQLATLFSPLS